jgi:cytochrome c-type biogenesis protein CcmE
MKPKFVFGIGLIAVAMLGALYFGINAFGKNAVTVNELVAQKTSGAALSERQLQLSGVVVGDSITYDSSNNALEFDVVHSRDDLVNNLASAPRVRVTYKGIKPDTLVNEAHAIVTGKIAADGKFHANSNSPDALLLQCPTKYENLAKEGSTK